MYYMYAFNDYSSYLTLRYDDIKLDTFVYMYMYVQLLYMYMCNYH